MFKILNVLESIIIIDGKRKKILQLEDGIFEDITKKAEKNKEVDNKYLIDSSYETMKNGFDLLKRNTILLTENQKEFDKKILEIQKEQLQKKIKWTNYQIEKLEKDMQYYTYELSNI